MDQVPARPPHKHHVHPPRDVHGPDAGRSRPAKLICPCEDDGGRIREELEEVLEGCFHGGERAPARLVHEVLDDALGAEIEAPETHTA